MAMYHSVLCCLIIFSVKCLCICDNIIILIVADLDPQSLIDIVYIIWTRTSCLRNLVINHHRAN